MTTSTSSADPKALFRYTDAAEQINHQLENEARLLEAALQRFATSCTEFNSGVAPVLANDLRAYVLRVAPQDVWVREVGIDFLRADGEALYGALEELRQGTDALDGIRDVVTILHGTTFWRAPRGKRAYKVPLSQLLDAEDGQWFKVKANKEAVELAGLEKEATYFKAGSLLKSQFGSLLRTSAKEAVIPASKLGKGLLGAQIAVTAFTDFQEFSNEDTGMRLRKTAVATACDTVLETGFTVAGTVAGSAAGIAVGGMIGGPIGAAIGSRIGGWLGGVVGGEIGERVAKTDPVKKARNWVVNNLFS